MKEVIKLLLGLLGVGMFGVGMLFLGFEVGRISNSALPVAALFIVVGVVLVFFSIWNNKKKK